MNVVFWTAMLVIHFLRQGLQNRFFVCRLNLFFKANALLEGYQINQLAEIIIGRNENSNFSFDKLSKIMQTVYIFIKEQFQTFLQFFRKN